MGFCGFMSGSYACRKNISLSKQVGCIFNQVVNCMVQFHFKYDIFNCFRFYIHVFNIFVRTEILLEVQVLCPYDTRTYIHVVQG